MKIMKSVWSLAAAVAVLIMLALSPVALSQQSDDSGIAGLEKLWTELNATMASLSQDMSNFDKANASINYSKEQVDGAWLNVINYTAKDGTVLKEYLDANNQTNRTMLIAPETLLTTLAADESEVTLTILASPAHPFPCRWVLVEKSTGGFPKTLELYNPCRLVKMTTTIEEDGTKTIALQDYTKKADNTLVVVFHPDGTVTKYVETRPGVPPECSWCDNTHQYECKEEKTA
ncbi:MAG: hypothetical protein PHW87_02975 [Methanothrix sp.]|nr:hypothetical protein [Methanothrix sp.]